MTKAVRALIASHVVVFGLGFALGKHMDADELALYRGANESLVQRLRRRAGSIVLSFMAVASIVVVFRLGGGGGKKSVDSEK